MSKINSKSPSGKIITSLKRRNGSTFEASMFETSEVTSESRDQTRLRNKSSSIGGSNLERRKSNSLDGAERTMNEQISARFQSRTKFKFSVAENSVENVNNSLNYLHKPLMRSGTKGQTRNSSFSKSFNESTENLTSNENFRTSNFLTIPESPRLKIVSSPGNLHRSIDEQSAAKIFYRRNNSTGPSNTRTNRSSASNMLPAILLGTMATKPRRKSMFANCASQPQNLFSSPNHSVVSTQVTSNQISRISIFSSMTSQDNLSSDTSLLSVIGEQFPDNVIGCDPRDKLTNQRVVAKKPTGVLDVKQRPKLPKVCLDAAGSCNSKGWFAAHEM